MEHVRKWYAVPCSVTSVLSDSLLLHGCSPSGSSVPGILQERILEWVTMPSSRGSSWPRDQTCIFCIADGFFTIEPPGKPMKWYSSQRKPQNTGAPCSIEGAILTHSGKQWEDISLVGYGSPGHKKKKENTAFSTCLLYSSRQILI